MSEKIDYFINAIRLVDVQGSTNIPSALAYQSSSAPSFGSDALELTAESSLVNEDFKVDLGNSRPGASVNGRYRCGDGRFRSAAELTADFIHGVITEAKAYLARNDKSSETSIYVAEPLAMQEGLVSDAWLANYRNYLRRILTGKGFKSIEFLPEPFAVYQYYRYGERHPLVSERRKHHALVLDFGGGTFDVCLIETTKDGDISESGRMAKPISASSIPIGGFFINRAIAEELLKKVLAPKKLEPSLNKGLDLYRRWRRGELEISTLAPNHQHFISNYHNLAHRVEGVKLALCRTIRDWSLEANLIQPAPVAVPSDPFVPEPAMVSVPFSAGELRHIFTTKIWERELKSAVRLSLQRGREELEGAPVTVVLLSGGSANIRWLSELLRRDFGDELRHAEILQLKDFQEVVAKGLAVECARRTYTPDRQGDFAAVTYNRLCCILDPDDTGVELKRFVPKDGDLPKVDIPGVLLPSASSLRAFEGKPMRWRVHLDHAPRTSLNYYFLRSSFDPGDVQNLQNIEERTVHTPRNIRHDSELTLELTVANDGTAEPTFIYKLGCSPSESASKRGRAFYLDMTTAEPEQLSNAYLGLDFGTSNTSVSYIDESSIQIYKRRSGEKFWNELSDLSSSLPFPLSASLASYLCQTDQAKLASGARDFLEAALTMAAYVAYIDYCLSKGRAQTKLFKGFTQRSAGPLWNFFRSCMEQTAGRRAFSARYAELLEPEHLREIDRAVTVVAEYKHGKQDDSAANVTRAVKILANITQVVFQDAVFGYFQIVQKQRFGKQYDGSFRHAHGRPPFVEVSHYAGALPFSDNETYLVDRATGKAVSLEPLILWAPCPRHKELENGHCFMFDFLDRDGTSTFKAAGFPCTLKANPTGEFPELATQLLSLAAGDSPIYPVEVMLD